MGLDVQKLLEAVEVVDVALKDFLARAGKGGHANLANGKERFLTLPGFAQNAEVGELFPAVLEGELLAVGEGRCVAQQRPPLGDGVVVADVALRMRGGNGFTVAVPERDVEADGGLEGVEAVAALPAHVQGEFRVLAADFAAQFLLAGAVVGHEGFEFRRFQQGVTIRDGKGRRQIFGQRALQFKVAHVGVQSEEVDEFKVLLQVEVVEFLQGFGGVEGALVGQFELGKLHFSQFIELSYLFLFVAQPGEAGTHEFLLGVADHDAVAQGVELLEEVAFLRAHGPVVGFFVLLGDFFGESGQAGDGQGKPGCVGLPRSVGAEGVGQFGGERGIIPEPGKLSDAGGFGIAEAGFVQIRVEHEADAVQIRQAQGGLGGAQAARELQPLGGVALQVDGFGGVDGAGRQQA